jgi:hypothetical protein
VHTTPGYTEVERAIRSVPGVAEASVVEAEDTGRGRLRIRLHPGEDAERVSWSVAATLRERFGIALDPEEIRPRMDDGASLNGEAHASDEVHASDEDLVVEEVAETRTSRNGAVSGDSIGSEVRGDATIPTVGPAPVAVAAPARAVIRDLASHKGEEGVVVTATLDVAGRVAIGRSTGVPTSRGLLRTIAQATVLALGELTGTRLRAEVDRVSLGGADPTTVTVVVTLLSARGEELLLGASIVRDDIEHAVMRATLDALNRRVEQDLAG